MEAKSLLAIEKRRIDPLTSVMTVQDYLGTDLKPEMRVGIFVVQGADNRVIRTVDIADFGWNAGPEIKSASRQLIDIDLYGDVVGYRGSVRYFYNLDGKAPAIAYRYGNIEVGKGNVLGQKIRFAAVSEPTLDGWQKYSAVVILTPGDPAGIPAYSIQLSEWKQPLSLPVEPAPHWRTPDGLDVVKAPESWSDGFDVMGPSGEKHRYPVPVPSARTVARMRPRDPPGGEIHNSIGSVAESAGKLWFGNSFYNGEGATGVGGIGEFDLASRTYRMHYIPEVAYWQVGALVRDGSTFWMGLSQFGEGWAASGGVGSFDVVTGAAKRYPIDRYIHSILRVGETVYCGTSDGIFLIRKGKLTQLRFAPDRTGKLVMISRNVN